MRNRVLPCIVACCLLACGSTAGATTTDGAAVLPVESAASDGSVAIPATPDPASTASDTWLATASTSDPSPPSTSSGGSKTESPLSLDYLKLIWADAKDTYTEPLRWDGTDWRNFGLITGGLVLTGAFLDQPIKDAAQRGRTAGSDHFFKVVQRFGTKQYGLPVMVAFYGYGAFADSDNSKQVALDAFSADTISALFSSTVKGLVGRARPNSGHGPGHFDPLQHDYSFPSGHATGAFTFASVIASHYDSPWVDATAYGIAGLVGVARVRLNAHWTSDVIAGALIGTCIGRHVVAFNQRARANGFSFVPTLGADENGLTLSWNF